MIQRAISRSVVILMLAVGIIFSAGFSSCDHAPDERSALQTQTLKPEPPPTPVGAPQLVFSTYLGGSSSFASGCNPLTFAQNAASDTLGNTYVTGATTVKDLPGTTNAYQPTPAPNSTMSAFVAKYGPTGQLLWCTYLGGDNQSMGIGVAAMPNGGVVVVGLTASDNFPTLNPYQAQNNATTGNSNYFVTVFDANGNPTYSTYLGGSGGEGQSPPYADDQNNGNCVAVDAAGLIYVAGMTKSSGANGGKKFPVTPNAQQGTIGGGMDACLCIIDPSQTPPNSSLIYASFLGGGGDDQGHSVAVNPSGSLITVAGYTTSINFPLVNAFDQAVGSTSSGFVTQFQSSQPGSTTSQYTMLYSTYLGGSNRDDTYGMTMDPFGLIVATGRTRDDDFPMTAAGPTIYNMAIPPISNDMPYVVKINPSLIGTASLVYSTYLGGQGGFCTSVGVDALGAVYVAGESTASGALYVPPPNVMPGSTTAPATFPYTENALIKALPLGFEHVIFMQIDPVGDSLSYSTYLGGSAGDRAYGLALDPYGNVVLTGLTFSVDFPLENQAQNYPNNGYQNAFVTKFSGF